MLKYADTIRELVHARARWQFYDEHFRRSRERAPWPWQSLQMELWGKAMTLFRYDGDNPEERPSTNRGGPRPSTSRPYHRSTATRSTATKAASDNTIPMELWGKAMTLFRYDGDNPEERPSTNRGGPRPSTSRPYHWATATRFTATKAASDNTIPPGYCWPYNRGEQCRGNCGYEHKCHRCDGDHPGCHCPQGQSGNRHKYKNRKPPSNPSKHR